MINLLLRRIMAFVSFLLITACASNTAAALDVPVATETPFDRAAALTLIAPTLTPTSTPVHWDVIPTISPRMQTGQDCVGSDERGPYSYGFGEYMLNSSVPESSGYTDPYYEVCEQGPDGPRLKIITSEVPDFCRIDLPPRWDENLNGFCFTDEQGHYWKWESVTRYVP